MPKKTWILTDIANGQHEIDFSITASEISEAKGSWQVKQRRLQGGLSDGVDLIEIDNGRMVVFVIPTRGMGIWKAEVDDKTLGWRSPVRGPVHPKFVPLFDSNGLGWLEGFDELVVRCGLESNGAPEFNAQGQLVYPLHGRIGNRPAHYVELTLDDEAITLRGIVEETRFHFQKLRLAATLTTKLDSTSFTIQDTVENYGGTSSEMQMLYHINIGQPLLNAGDRIVAPVRTIKNRDSDGPLSTNHWDQYGPPGTSDTEDCFYMELHPDELARSKVLLKNSTGRFGTLVDYDAKSLPCFSLWKNQVNSPDGFVTGLEPATNYPNPRTIEKNQGRVVDLDAGETWSTEVTIAQLTSAAEVSSTENEILKLVPSKQ